MEVPMSKRTPTLFFVVIGAALTLLLAGATAAATLPSLSPPGKPAGPPSPVLPGAGMSSPLEGIPAISPTTKSAAPGTPAFTEDDVRAYLASHSIPDLTSGHTATVEQVEFITNRDLRARFGHGSGGPDDRLVCLVTLRGEFSPSLPPALQQRGKPRVTSPMIRHVYDAHTGNRLIEGLAQ
jgi:hypothetical protein